MSGTFDLSSKSVTSFENTTSFGTISNDTQFLPYTFNDPNSKKNISYPGFFFIFNLTNSPNWTFSIDDKLSSLIGDFFD